VEKCSACFGSSGRGLGLMSSSSLVLGLGLVSSDLGLATRGLFNITVY